VPDRASSIPSALIDSVDRNINESPVDIVACTGDLTNPKMVMPFLNRWGKNLVIVQGNMDYYSQAGFEFNWTEKFSTKSFIKNEEPVDLGIIHGHQVHPRGDRDRLSRIGEKLGVRILISGHTHALDVSLHYNKDLGKAFLLVNPGSATGAWSFLASNKPSFIILEILFVNGAYEIKLSCYEFTRSKEKTWVDVFRLKNGVFSN